MPQNPYNPPPAALGVILNQIYGIDNKPYDSTEVLWTKVARSLGVTLSDYNDLEVILSRIADAGAAPASSGGDSGLTAGSNTNEFLSQLGLDGWGRPSNLVGITEVSLNVENFIGYLDFEECPDLVSVTFSNMVTMGDGDNFTYLWISDCPSFTTFSAPLLTAITRGHGSSGMVLANNDVLVTINMPSLVTVEGKVNISFNPLLTDLSLPNWLPDAQPGMQHAFQGNNLSAASVNHILARCVANAAFGTNGEDLRLDLGTNAAPTGQGLVDKATIIARGGTVVTN